MIRQITGTVLAIEEGAIVIEVGGIGYEVRVALNALITAKEGDELSLFTHFVVRETSQELYAFPTLRERSMFLLLIDLPGIGPKSALHILSQADVRLLEEAAERNDPLYLSKLSGIGKKSAEKIVAGLKDKVVPTKSEVAQTDDNDFIDALLALGYSTEEARTALRSLPPGTVGTKDRLKEALKVLGS